MDLWISAVLMALLTASKACNDTEPRFGSFLDSRLCYECNGVMDYCLNKRVMCPIGFSKCMNSAIVMKISGTTLKINKKECIDDCHSGSMNFGVSQAAYSCCDTDFCNIRYAPDPRNLRPNGRTCYYCDGPRCSNTVSCSGNEDACFTATLINGKVSIPAKGCTTKAICGLLKCSFIQDLSCCEGNLCNGDNGVTPGFIYNRDKSLVTQSVIQSFMYKVATRDTQKIPNNGAKSDRQRVPNNGATRDTQSFLFLCCSLLSYVLLH